jgi:hypothetical protein
VKQHYNFIPTRKRARISKLQRANRNKGSIVIYDGLGKTVIMQNNRSLNNNMSVDVSTLANGAYLVAVITNNKRMTAKLIVEK